MDYTILDFMIEADIVLSGAEGRKILSHNAAMIFPIDYQRGDPYPDCVRVIQDPNHILDEETVICIVKDVYRFRGPGNWELIDRTSPIVW